MKALLNRPDLFQVMEKQCDACLFSKDRIVDGARVAEILKGCKESGTHFICHKASLEGKNVCCRVFYDTQDTLVIHMAKMLGRVVFVQPGEPK